MTHGGRRYRLPHSNRPVDRTHKSHPIPPSCATPTTRTLTPGKAQLQPHPIPSHPIPPCPLSPQTEVELLSQLRHPALVELTGYSADPDSGERSLVYEFMGQGSLERHLFGREWVPGSPFNLFVPPHSPSLQYHLRGAMSVHPESY